jgi:hypothetical protein
LDRSNSSPECGRGGLYGGHTLSGFGGGETINNFCESAPDPAGARADDALLDQGQDGVQGVGYDVGGSDPGFEGGGFDA